MAKNEKLTMPGKIVRECGRGYFDVRLNDSGHVVKATLSGKMRTRYIRTGLHDRVKVEVCPYDLSKGRIVYRELSRSDKSK